MSPNDALLTGRLTSVERRQLGALLNAGRFAEVESWMRQLIELHPASGFAWKVLGAVLQAQGKESIPTLQKATELSPDDADAHSDYGNALRERGRLDDAAASYCRALAIRPGFAAAHNNLGNVLRDHGQLDAAVTSYRRALSIKPDFIEAHSNLGNALSDLGQLDSAVACYRHALMIKPDFAEAHNNLSSALRGLGLLHDAMASCHQALILEPDFAEAHDNLGNALAGLGKLHDAVTSYHRAIAIKPDFAEAHNNLASVLRDLGRLDDAVTSCHQALAIKPNFAEAHGNLGNAQRGLGQLNNAVVSCRRALAIKPGLFQTHSALLFCLSHSEEMGAMALLTEHLGFADQFEAPLRGQWPQHTHSRDPERRLQVGFVSGDFRYHAVANFIEPVLAHLATYPQVSLHAYYNHRLEDSVTQRLRRHFMHWNPVVCLSDDALSTKVRSDGIDILVDLSGHTAHNRLLSFARKPAPIQVTWVGYPNTTGLQAMDYVLCDRFNAPPGLHEAYYVEKFARLPSSGTFAPQASVPEVNGLPALGRGYVTFGSFNRLEKIGKQVIRAWSQVLHAVPNSRMLLGNIADPSAAQCLTEGFSQHGIAAERLLFRPPLPLYDYLVLHHEVDLILDTWPYTGGTISNYALCMGVPVVTLLGPRRAHCQSAAVLGRLGLQNWVARDVPEFVRIATDWSHSLPALAQLRAGLRERWQTAPLRQPATVARGMEHAFRFMWRRWCAGLPAKHFEIASGPVMDSQFSEPASPCNILETSSPSDEE